jgi:hypothetical protein
MACGHPTDHVALIIHLIYIIESTNFPSFERVYINLKPQQGWVDSSVQGQAPTGEKQDHPKKKKNYLQKIKKVFFSKPI